MDWFKEQQASGKLNETFHTHHFHSDNAGQHFKNKYSARFLTLYRIKYGLKFVTWSFGCPGHGKGPWDGLGGTMKNWLARQALEFDQHKEPHRTALDCAEALHAHFGSEAWATAHAKRTISKCVIHYVTEGAIKRDGAHYAVDEEGCVSLEESKHCEIASFTGPRMSPFPNLIVPII